jgi:pyruvoyl-dependent arginine decarboxylase (PvlArgDC)
MPYLTAAKQLTIKNRMREDMKKDAEILLTEVAAGLAADAPGEDIATAIGLAISQPAGAIHVAYDAADVATTLAHRAAVVAALAQDISTTYVEAEVQAISTKLDAVIAALKTAGLMASA